MLPEITINEDLNFQHYPSLTYSLNGGMIDGIDAIQQAIYKILNTERFEHVMYTWNYGIETFDLFGADIDYVEVDIKRRITEALKQDDRVLSVDGFSFEREKGKLHITFTVETATGEVIMTYDI